MISQKSCDVLRELGPQIQWLHSYVTGDKIYCIYIAHNEAVVRAHAQRGGFPANRISEIKQVIDPTTAEMTQPDDAANPSALLGDVLAPSIPVSAFWLCYVSLQRKKCC